MSTETIEPKSSVNEAQDKAGLAASGGSAIRVKFKDVGGGKMCWEQTLPDLEYRTLLKALKARGAICSRYPDFAVDDDGTGSIFAGFRCVGTFEWQNAEMSHAHPNHPAVPGVGAGCENPRR